MTTTFIAAERLGSVLETRAITLTDPETKRARHFSFKQMARLLKDLKIVDGEPKMIAYGLDEAGNRGLIVFSAAATRIEGSIAP